MQVAVTLRIDIDSGIMYDRDVEEKEWRMANVEDTFRRVEMCRS